MKMTLSDNKFIVLLICGVAFYTYSPSLDGDFVFDDSEAIVHNEDILPKTPIREIFRHDFWGNKLDSDTSHKSYRPLTILFYRVIRKLYGSLTPYPFHVINVVLHLIVTVLAYFVYRIILGEKKKSLMLSTFLFAVHPIHTECIAGIVGQAELLSALFAFLSFIVYDYGCYNLNSCLQTVVYIVVSCTLAATAMLCKEQGIAIIGICGFYDIINNFGLWTTFYNNLKEEMRVNRDLFVVYNNGIETFGNLLLRYRMFVFRQIILFLASVFILYSRWMMMGFKTPVFQPVDNPAAFQEYFITRVLNYNYIYALNAWLLICPMWLCYDWSMGCIPLISPAKFPPDYRILLVFFFWIVMAMLFGRIIAGGKKLTTHRRSIAFGLFWMIILFLPASNILFTVGFVVAERVLYLPSFGFNLIVVTGFDMLFKYYGKRKSIGVFPLMVVAVTFIVRSLERSKEWNTEEGLFRSALSVCPGNAKVHYNVAKNAADSSNLQLALKHYSQAIELNPEYSQAMNNLANIIKDAGDYEEASELLKRALKNKPDIPATWMNLGVIQALQKHYKEAEQSYMRALKFKKKYPNCYFNLGNLYLHQQRLDDALEAWFNAISYEPEHSKSWVNILVTLERKGEWQKGVELGLKALKHLPNDDSIHFSLGNIFGQLKDFKAAEQHYLQAIQLNPNHHTYHANLGVVYHLWGKRCQARHEYEVALTLDPTSQTARDNLNKVAPLSDLSCHVF